jgi:hypothetical protein
MNLMLCLHRQAALIVALLLNSVLRSFATRNVVLVCSVQQLRLALETSNDITVQNDLKLSYDDWPASAAINITEGRHVIVSGTGATYSHWPLIDFNFLRSLIRMDMNSSLEFSHLWVTRFRFASASAFPGECEGKEV